jgi:hypothetical protein
MHRSSLPFGLHVPGPSPSLQDLPLRQVAVSTWTSFPTAGARGLIQTGTAYVGQRTAQALESYLHDISEDSPNPVIGGAVVGVIATGSLIAWQTGRLLQSGRQARAAHSGEPVSGREGALYAAATLMVVVAPLATAFVMVGISGPEEGCAILGTVMGIYIGNLARDIANEMMPRPQLAEYDGPQRLTHDDALLRRCGSMMTTSLVFNIPVAAVGRLALGPALAQVDPALSPAIVRGLWAVGNELSKGWAASRDGEAGTVRPEAPHLPRLGVLRESLEDTALRSTLALAPRAAYGLAKAVRGGNEPAAVALEVLGDVLAGLGETRGVHVELGRIRRQRPEAWGLAAAVDEEHGQPLRPDVTPDGPRPESPPAEFAPVNCHDCAALDVELHRPYPSVE